MYACIYVCVLACSCVCVCLHACVCQSVYACVFVSMYVCAFTRVSVFVGGGGGKERKGVSERLRTVSASRTESMFRFIAAVDGTLCQMLLLVYIDCVVSSVCVVYPQDAGWEPLLLAGAGWEPLLLAGAGSCLTFLPREIRHIQSTSAFKTAMIGHLFKFYLS